MASSGGALVADLLGVEDAIHEIVTVVGLACRTHDDPIVRAGDMTCSANLCRAIVLVLGTVCTIECSKTGAFVSSAST